MVFKYQSKRHPDALNVLRLVEEEDLDVSEITKEMRQGCIEILTREAYSDSAIAMKLRTTISVVESDQNEIQAVNSKALYVSRVRVEIETAKGKSREIRRTRQDFKKGPGEDAYKAITREIVIKEARKHAKRN